MDDDEDVIFCDHCGEMPDDADDVNDTAQEGPDGSTVWNCRKCGGWSYLFEF